MNIIFPVTSISFHDYRYVSVSVGSLHVSGKASTVARRCDDATNVTDVTDVTDATKSTDATDSTVSGGNSNVGRDLSRNENPTLTILQV